jgi:DNA-binding NtrC family response regulator
MPQLPETERPHVLVVDDEVSVRESLRLILKDRSDVTLVASGEAALESVSAHRYDVILLDILMPGRDGLEILESIRALTNVPQVIMLTATKTVKTAVRAMKLGAFDYVTKPFDIDELIVLVERAAQASALLQEVTVLRQEVGRRYSFDNVIGRSAAMQNVLNTVSRIAPLRTTVLLTGESGTGKEVIAKAIHYNSPRASGPLVAINCAAIPENLLESELFGHERGAFTDAHTRKLGHFENAHRGTIFLDEIGEMNPGTQAKLLRVLEQGTFARVGGSQPVTVDVRVIAATNRDLDKGMKEGTFRPDLYFRLNVVAIHLPPLRDRRDDLPLLIRHFLTRKSSELGLPEKNFDRDALDCLLRYAWPGNVRELENLVERALALAQGDALTPEDLPPHLTTLRSVLPTRPAVAEPEAAAGPPSLNAAVEQLEHMLIMDALAQADQNQTRAAEILGTTRRILKYKMDKLGITALDTSEFNS